MRDAKAVNIAGKEALHTKALALAHRKVREVHFDYDDISTADKILKRMIPFWQYESNQIRWMGEQISRRPGLAMGAYQGQKAVKDMRLPGMPATLAIDGFDLLSWQRFTKTAVQPDLWKVKGKPAPALGKALQAAEKAGFFVHPAIEQSGPLINALAGKDLLDDRQWKNCWPAIHSIGKMFGKNLSYEGIRILVKPGERESRMESGVNKLFNRRVFERRAYSLLEGKPLTLQQSEKYVQRESMVAGALALMGVYVKVREPEAQRMIKMLDDYDGKSFARQLEIRRSNKALDAYLYGQGR